MGQKFANNYRTTVAVQLLAGGASLQVAAGGGAALVAQTGEPSAANFVKLTLARRSGGDEVAWEIIKVIGRSGDVFDITGGRGQEGTAAIQWEVGERVEARFTRDSIVVPAGLFTQSFETPEQAITVGSTSYNHVMTAPARVVQLWARCKTGEQGFAAGDEVQLAAGGRDSGATNYGAYAWLPNGGVSQVAIAVGSTAAILITRPTDGVDFAIVNANWKLFARVFA
jgi:hypothetical protein